MESLYNIKSHEFLNNVKHALKSIRKLKYKVNNPDGVAFHADIKYQEPAVRCAYLYSYSILNTAIVYTEFFKYLKNDETLLIQFSKKTLKICCLAGGPGNEAIAVTKAIRDFAAEFSNEVDLFRDVHVTVVDIINEWKAEGESIVHAVNRSSSLFNGKEMKFHYSFLKADLFSPFEEHLREKIAEADIITIVKFGSSVEEKSASSQMDHMKNMIKDVIGCMEKGSCLFMMDVAGGKIFSQLAGVIYNQPNKFKLQQRLHKKYRLLPKTLQKMENFINFKNFPESSILFPTKLTTISSCIWFKKGKQIKEKKTKKNLGN